MSAESPEYIKNVVQQISNIVADMAGIQLGTRQASMVENRLRSRMARLGIASFQEYVEFLNKNQEAESQALLSLMTTHHTYFFREFTHFEYLLNNGLPALIERAKVRGDKKIRVWSAACSRGQEVYSLAMFFDFHVKVIDPSISVEIWATDVDPESVKIAQNGVYKSDELKKVPAMYLQKHWVVGKDSALGFSKAKDSLRKYCKFESANLLQPESFLKGKTFDLIFCRNVFIYFDAGQITSVTNSFLKHLDPAGFIFLGVSESLNGLKLGVKLVGASIYRIQDTVKSPVRPSAPGATTPASILSQAAAQPMIKPVEKKIFEVLCIDDSPTIHAIFSKILTPEYEFRITGKAKNGREAIELLKSKRFDVITLDLHMPELDGIGFLQEHTDRSTPILIVSSVNRDEASLGKKALELGAFDYVEKPSLENLAQAGNEIRSKLKSGLSMKKLPAASKGADRENVATAPLASQKIRVLIVDDSKTIRDLLSRILLQDPAFEIAGQADRPSLVPDMIRTLQPDLMTLDIQMPEMDGVKLLKSLPPNLLIPTVMISSISYEEGPQVLDALESGAIDYIQKPNASELGELAPLIRERLKSAAAAKVRKHGAIHKVRASNAIDSQALVVVGSSTGGTEALRVMLQSLPENIPPILIVQHIPPVFSKAFADRMNSLCQFEVKEAANLDEIVPNRVLIAPGGLQMAVAHVREKLVVRIHDDAPVNRHKPSVDYLFQSVAKLRLPKVVGVILTGMGADGAKQMRVLRDLGARTIAQDQATCVVFGMPREAIELKAAEYILPIDQIGHKIIELSNKALKKAV